MRVPISVIKPQMYMRIVLLAGIFIFLQTLPLFSQDEGPKSVIKTNPFGLAFGNFNVAYEKVLNRSSSLQFKGRYTYRFLGLKVNVAGLGAGYRYYLTQSRKPAPGGFYINPELAINSGSSGSIRYGTFVIGGEIGYQIASRKGVAFDVGIGPKYTTFFGSYEELDFNGVSSTGVLLPGLTVAVGYAF